MPFGASTRKPRAWEQVKALRRAGCAVIYSDTASGKSMAGRPELARALDELDAGDELLIAEWDRATRSMWDGLQIIKATIDAGATIKVLDRGYIDLTTPDGARFHGVHVRHGRRRTLADYEAHP
jgi:DNA invertase Pin-like site-specific DNA recombinase